MVRIELTFRNLLLLLALLLFGYVAYRLREIVVLIGLAVMLMATLHPFVNMAERRGMSHGRAVALVVTSAVLLPILVIAALSPLVISEVSDFAASFPTLQQHINQLLHNWGLADQVNRAIDRLDLQSKVADLAVVGVQQTISIFIEVFTIVVIGAYLLADSHRLQLLIHEFVPRDSERHIEPLLSGMERVVGGYIRGQLLTSAMFGVFGFVLCFALGVPNPLLLGIVAAIGDIIPVFGVPLAMVITVIVAFTSSVWQPVGVVAGYVIYGQLESHFLVPRIYARTVNMSPLAVIVATIAGGALDGFIGIFIAIPVAGALKVILDYIVAERVKGREAAMKTMHSEITDPVGRVDEKEEGTAADAPPSHDDLPEGVPAPTFSPFEPIPQPEPEPQTRLSGARYVTLAHVKAHKRSPLRALSRRAGHTSQEPGHADPEGGEPEHRPAGRREGNGSQPHTSKRAS